MTPGRVICSLTVLVLVVYASDTPDTLRVTNVLYRHGDRAPTLKLPLDRVNSSYWKYGYGELTEVGKAEQYRLGLWLRQQYDPILTKIFDHTNIEVRSSDKDRCLVSAYSNLAGLYSNQTPAEDLQLPYVRWQPVPVHTEPVITDEILAMNRPCSKVDKSQIEAFTSPAVLQINKDYASFFKLVANHTGLDLSSNGFRDIWLATDSLYCESLHGLPLPSWTQQQNVSCSNNVDIPCEGKTVWQVMKEMSDLQFLVMFNTSVLHRFEGGPLLEDIVSKFKAYVAGHRTIQFNMYSAHDTTVAATLSALGVFDEKQPEYASAVMIELHNMTTDAEKWEVKVFYKPVTDNNTVLSLSMPGCKSPCSLTDFALMLDKYKITDWDTACENNPKPVPPTSILGLTESEVIVITICTAVVFILLIISCICWVRGRSGGHRGHIYDRM
ncbi:putative acid phosphatase 5 [Watersipora subatra]|uniref:putative acid phosphatase 5 n=1 Tax=Watersipora subatra TaxID=2589382 RepID=UPI00355C194C